MTSSPSQTFTPSIRLDAAWLAELGLGELAPDVANDLLAFAYEKLEMNVGMRLASQMTSEQLDQFEAFVDSGDERGALGWLEERFPDYREVVRAEFSLLSTNLRIDAQRLLAALASERSA